MALLSGVGTSQCTPAVVVTALCGGVALGIFLVHAGLDRCGTRLLRKMARCYSKIESSRPPRALAAHIRSPRSGRTRFQTQALVETIESMGDEEIDELIDAFQARHGRAPRTEELETEVYRSASMADVIERHLERFEVDIKSWISNRLAAFDEREDRSNRSKDNDGPCSRHNFKASLEATAKILLAERSHMLRQETVSTNHTSLLDDLCITNITSFCSVKEAGALAIADKRFYAVFRPVYMRFQSTQDQGGVELADKIIAGLQALKPFAPTSSCSEGSMSRCLALRVFRATTRYRARQAKSKWTAYSLSAAPSVNCDELFTCIRELDVDGAYVILKTRGFDPRTSCDQSIAKSPWSALMANRGRPALARRFAMEIFEVNKNFEEISRSETPLELEQRKLHEDKQLLRMVALLIAFGCDPSDPVCLRWSDTNEDSSLEQSIRYQSLLDAAVGHLDLCIVKFLQDCGLRSVIPFSAPHDSVLVDIYCALPCILASGETLPACYYAAEENMEQLITTECAFHPIRELLLKHGASESNFAKWDLAIGSAIRFVLEK